MNVSHESNGKDFPSFASAEHVGSVLERTNLKHLLHFQRIDPTHSSLQMKQEESLLPSSLDALRHKTERKELSAQPNLSISLGPTLMTSPFHDAAVDDRSKTNSIFQLAPRSRQLLPKPANSAPIAAGMEPSGSLVSQIHVARPPPEGRGKTQLLPRYWPRITDQELLQLSGQYPHLYVIISCFCFYSTIMHYFSVLRSPWLFIFLAQIPKLYHSLKKFWVRAMRVVLVDWFFRKHVQR